MYLVVFRFLFCSVSVGEIQLCVGLEFFVVSFLNFVYLFWYGPSMSKRHEQIVYRTEHAHTHELKNNRQIPLLCRWAMFYCFRVPTHHRGSISSRILLLKPWILRWFVSFDHNTIFLSNWNTTGKVSSSSPKRLASQRFLITATYLKKNNHELTRKCWKQEFRNPTLRTSHLNLACRLVWITRPMPSITTRSTWLTIMASASDRVILLFKKIIINK